MSTCPRCNGKGRTGPVHVNYSDRPHEWLDSMPCPLCAGAGSITEEQVESVRMGEAIRRARIDRSESLREAAVRYGVTPSELSKFEQGRVPLDAWQHPFATRLWLEATR